MEKRLELLTATELLAIPIDEPERLFALDSPRAQMQYRAFVKRWHPDICTDPRAATVIAHINALNSRAEEKRKSGTWETPGALSFVAKDGQSHHFTYWKRRPFALGHTHICSSAVVFQINHDYVDLAQNYLATTARFRFGSLSMQEEMGRYLPNGVTDLSARQTAYVTVGKSASLICLQDLLDVSGPLEPRHVAWVLSRLYGILCYFEYAGIAHGDISPETFFIDPAQHTGVLLGGWWYTRRHGERLVALPPRSITVCPPDILADTRADVRLDRALVRLLGRELLGDHAGVSLHMNSAIPKPLADWLLGVSSGTALQEFQSWQRVLLASFGPRRFAELATSASDIYGRSNANGKFIVESE